MKQDTKQLRLDLQKVSAEAFRIAGDIAAAQDRPQAAYVARLKAAQIEVQIAEAKHGA